MTRDPFATPVDGRTQLALQCGTAWLLLLGGAYGAEAWSPVFTVWSLGRTPAVVTVIPWALTAALGVASVMFLVGVRPRAAGLTACALLAGLYGLIPATYHNNYYLLFLFVLVTASGAHPEYQPRWFVQPTQDPGRSPAVVPLLIRWQVAIAYAGSAAVKLTHPWWQGTGQVIRWLAVEHLPHTLHGWWNLPLRMSLADPRAAAMTDVLVTATEILLPLGLLTARRRRLALGIGIGLHVFMQEWLFPQLFTFLMLLGYYAFVPSGDRAWRVTCNPAHPLDRALALWFPRVDWLARTRWELDTATSDLTAVHPDGTTVTGTLTVLLLAVLTPVPLLAWATFSLAAPGTLTVFGIPRPDLENTVVTLGVTLGLVACLPGVGRWLYRRAGTPWSVPPPHGRKSSHLP